MEGLLHAGVSRFDQRVKECSFSQTEGRVLFLIKGNEASGRHDMNFDLQPQNDKIADPKEI